MSDTDKIITAILVVAWINLVISMISFALLSQQIERQSKK